MKPLLSTVVAAALLFAPALGLAPTQKSATPSPAISVFGNPVGLETRPGSPVITALELDSFAPGEPTLPSVWAPYFALIFSVSADTPRPGDTVTIDLPADMRAIINTPDVSVTLAEGEDPIRIGTLSSERDRSRVQLEFSDAVRGVRDLHVNAIVMVQVSGLTGPAGTYAASLATSSGTFPVSTGYSAAQDAFTDVGSYWVHPRGNTASSTETALVAQEVFASHPEYSDGQRFVAQADSYSPLGAEIAALCGGIRITEFSAVPETLSSPLTGGTPLTEADGVTTSCGVTDDGRATTTAVIAVPKPNVYYVLSQDFAVLEPGETLALVPNEPPTPSRAIGIYNWDLKSGAAGSPNLGGLTSTVYFGISQALAVAVPATIGVGVERGTVPEPGTVVTGGEKIDLSLTVRNTGNVPVQATVCDIISGVAPALLDVRVEPSPLGIAGVTPGDSDVSVSWTGPLEPGDSHTLNYSVRVSRTLTEAAELRFNARADAASDTGLEAEQESPEVEFPVRADPTATVSPSPSEPASPTPTPSVPATPSVTPSAMPTGPATPTATPSGAPSVSATPTDPSVPPVSPTEPPASTTATGGPGELGATGTDLPLAAGTAAVVVLLGALALAGDQRRRRRAGERA